MEDDDLTMYVAPTLPPSPTRTMLEAISVPGNDNVMPSGDVDNFGTEDEEVETARAEESTYEHCGLTALSSRKKTALFRDNRKSSLTSSSESLFAASNISRLMHAMENGDYTNVSAISSVVLSTKETTRMVHSQLIDGVKYLAANPANRPQRCHIWIKDIHPEEFIACIQSMMSVKSQVRRSMLRLEMRDVFTSLRTLLKSMLHIKHLGFSVRMSNLYASIRDVTSKIMHKATGPFMEFLKYEEELKKTPGDLLIHFIISQPDEKQNTIHMHYFDKVVTPHGQMLRHQYLTVDQVLSEEQGVRFSDDIATHDFEVELDSESGEMVPTSAAYPQISDIPTFLDFCSGQ